MCQDASKQFVKCLPATNQFLLLAVSLATAWRLPAGFIDCGWCLADLDQVKQFWQVSLPTAILWFSQNTSQQSCHAIEVTYHQSPYMTIHYGDPSYYCRQQLLQVQQNRRSGFLYHALHRTTCSRCRWNQKLSTSNHRDSGCVRFAHQSHYTYIQWQWSFTSYIEIGHRAQFSEDRV